LFKTCQPCRYHYRNGLLRLLSQESHLFPPKGLNRQIVAWYFVREGGEGGGSIVLSVQLVRAKERPNRPEGSKGNYTSPSPSEVTWFDERSVPALRTILPPPPTFNNNHLMTFISPCILFRNNLSPASSISEAHF
jgi:hypothetical protein